MGERQRSIPQMVVSAAARPVVTTAAFRPDELRVRFGVWRAQTAADDVVVVDLLPDRAGSAPPGGRACPSRVRLAAEQGRIGQQAESGAWVPAAKYVRGIAPVLRRAAPKLVREERAGAGVRAIHVAGSPANGVASQARGAVLHEQRVRGIGTALLSCQPSGLMCWSIMALMNTTWLNGEPWGCTPSLGSMRAR
jgi:hypothetical protein